MREHGISQLPVIANGEILGGLGERYLLKLLLSNSEAWHHNVLEFMEDPFPVVPENTPVDDLVSYLEDRVQALIVERNDGGQTIVTKSDLIFTLLKAEREKSAR